MTAIWVVKAGNANVLADRLEQKSAVAIGWAEIGDLSALPDRQQVLELVRKEYPADTPAQQAMAGGQVYRFVREIRPSDYILTPIKATRTVLMGKAEGDYVFDPALFGPEYPHTRKVKWIRSGVAR